MTRILKWLLRRVFDLTVIKVDEELILLLSSAHLRASGNKWRSKYLYFKIEYCSEKFIDLYGMDQYARLASRILKNLEEEEGKSVQKIDEAMRKFIKMMD